MHARCSWLCVFEVDGDTVGDGIDQNLAHSDRGASAPGQSMLLCEAAALLIACHCLAGV